MAEAKAFFEQCIQHEIDADRWSTQPRTVDEHTIGDLDFIRAVMRVETPEDARQFYEGAVEFHREKFPEPFPRVHTPEDVVRQNIGWCFGEGMADERTQMWVRVTGSYHPVFGEKCPTPQEAFDAGVAAGLKKA